MAGTFSPICHYLYSQCLPNIEQTLNKYLVHGWKQLPNSPEIYVQWKLSFFPLRSV